MRRLLSLRRPIASALRKRSAGPQEDAGRAAPPRAAVFIDLANLAHMLEPVRRQGQDMDYCKFLRWLALGRSVVAARIYTGLDDSKPSIRSFLRRLQQIGYEVVRSSGKSYRDGSVKRPNADVLLVTDLLAHASASTPLS